MEILFLLGSWVLISLSIFNGLALLWLGLTMFLVADERQFGLWLVLFGMGMAGLFFLSHTVILANQLTNVPGIDVEVWWRLGWLPIIIAPLLWYMLILWYVGYWDSKSGRLHLHRYALISLIMVAFALLFLHIFYQPIPTFEQTAFLDFSNTTDWYGIPASLIIFPPFAILCVLLPLHALRHPTPSRRKMGDIARQRARPWLMGTSILLLCVALIVSLFILYVILPDSAARGVRETTIFILPMVVLDLAVTGLIAGAIIALGQAVVSYEIFTGKTLPRRGFARQWLSSIAITIVISAFIGYCLMFQVRLIYGLIVLAGLCVILFAVLSWRTFVYRNEVFTRLRPFMNGQFLMQDLIKPEHDTIHHAQMMFEAVCRSFLETTQAQITPTHALASLINTSLIYPAYQPAYDLPLSDDSIHIQLEPDEHAGFRWQIPLWSERGLIGMLLIGDKVSGGLFTEEEIQVAQAAAERIIDTLAGEQIARRLMTLQRHRMTEQRVMDFQTRRALHDDILPMIHMVVLSMSADNTDSEALQTLMSIHQQISTLIHTAPDFARQADTNVLERLQHIIQQEFVAEFEAIHWDLPDADLQLDTLTQDIIVGATREVIRNSAIHGRGDNPKRRISLWITAQHADTFQLCIRDNGVGHKTAEKWGGSGSGLSLHSTLLTLVNGTLTTQSDDDGFTTNLTLYDI